MRFMQRKPALSTILRNTCEGFKSSVKLQAV